MRFHVQALCVGCRGHRRDRIFDDRGDIRRLHFQPRLAEDDARDVEHILDDLRQRAGVAIDHFQRLWNLLLGNGARLQHARIAEHGVQWRSQLVGQRREEFVLQPVRALQLLIRLRGLDRHG